MSSEVLQIGKRVEAVQVDKAVSKLRGEALAALQDKPGYVDFRRALHVTGHGHLSFFSDQGTINAWFEERPASIGFAVTRDFVDDKKHYESVQGVREKSFLLFWKFYDSASLEYRLDGLPLKGTEAVPGARRLLESVKKAKPIETARATSAS